MNTELPRPVDYYRPTRARELRAEVARLERLEARLGRWSRGAALGAILWFLLLTRQDLRWVSPWLSYAALCVSLGAFAVAAVLSYARTVLRGRVEDREIEIRDLGDKHETRHGSLLGTGTRP